MSSIPKPDGPDVNIGAPMMRTIWVLNGISMAVVGLRLYTQFVKSHLDLGDAIMTMSMICGIMLCTMLTVQFHYGLGRHFFYLSDYQRVQAIEFNFLGQAFGIMGPAFGRMASCLLMLKLFGTNKFRRRLLWTIFWESLFVNSLTLILVYVQCKDVRTLWDHAGHPSACWSPLVQEYTGFVQGALNSATDLVLTILPASIFWTLQISMKLKLGLGFLLSLSFFAFIACVVKTVLLQSLAQRSDFTFNTVSFFTWVIVEVTLVNVAASVPLIRPLFVRRSPHTGNTSYEMKNQYGSRSGRGTRLKSSSGDETAAQLGAGKGSLHGTHGGDNSSEERILPIEGVLVGESNGDKDVEAGLGGGNGTGKKGIMRSTTYVVSYDKEAGATEDKTKTKRTR